MFSECEFSGFIFPVLDGEKANSTNVGKLNFFHIEFTAQVDDVSAGEYDLALGVDGARGFFLGRFFCGFLFPCSLGDLLSCLFSCLLGCFLFSCFLFSCFFLGGRSDIG